VTAQCDANNRSAIGRHSAEPRVVREKVGNAFPVITLGNLETLNPLPQLKRGVVIANGKFSRFDVIAHLRDQEPVIGYLTSGRLLAPQLSSLRDVDNEIKPSHQRFVDVGAIGGGEDREAAIFPGSPQ
jgi:hypothetical protein